jgi:hypothetical protein
MSRAETRSALGTGAFVGAAGAACCAPPLIAALGLTLGLAAVAGVVAGIAAAVAVVVIGAASSPPGAAHAGVATSPSRRSRWPAPPAGRPRWADIGRPSGSVGL